MVIVVTGHRGFIGSHLCNLLTQMGAPWVGVDRDARDGPNEIRADVRALRHRDLPGAVDTVVHLASPVGVVATGRNPEATRRAIIAGTRAVAAIARTLGALLVHVSSSEVHGRVEGPIDAATPSAPVSGYGRGKAEAETLALASRAVVVRPFNVYGSGQKAGFFVPELLRALRSGSAVPLTDRGLPIRQFTYVGDVARALAMTCWEQHEGAMLPIAGPEALRLAEAVTLAAEVLGVAATMRSVSPAVLARPPGTEIPTRIVDEDYRRALGDMTPSTVFRQGIARTVGLTNGRP